MIYSFKNFQKIAIVDIQGGLGNQLFQYLFAKYLESNNFKIYIYIGKDYLNVSQKKTYSEQRELIFEPEIFGFKILPRFANVVLELLKKFKFFNKHYYEIIKEESFNLNKNFKLITSFNGFWQNSIFLNNNVDFIKKSIKKILPNNITNFSEVLVQVRRGDFLKTNFYLKEDFYKYSFEILYKKYKTFNFDVVTDDVLWVKQDNLLSKANVIYPPSDEKEKVKKLFSSMLNYDNYIIGNSTFSFWAALLSSNESSYKIIEKNFFERIELNKNPRFSNWIKV